MDWTPETLRTPRRRRSEDYASSWRTPLAFGLISLGAALLAAAFSGGASAAGPPANFTDLPAGASHFEGHLNQTDVLFFRLAGNTTTQWHAAVSSYGATGQMTVFFTDLNETAMWPVPLHSPQFGYNPLFRTDWLQPFYNGTPYFVSIAVVQSASNASVGLNFTADFEIAAVPAVGLAAPNIAPIALSGGGYEHYWPYFAVQATAGEELLITAQMSSVGTDAPGGALLELDVLAAQRPFAGYTDFPAGWIRGFPLGRGEFWATQPLNQTNCRGTNCQLQGRFVAPYTGVYYAYVFETISPFNGVIQVSVAERTAGRSLDGNDAPTEAQDLFHVPVVRGNLSFGPDNMDWYRIDITPPASLSFTLALNDPLVYPTNVAFDHTAGSTVYVYELAVLSPDTTRALAVGNSEMPGLVGGASNISLTVPAVLLQSPGTYWVKVAVLLTGHPNNASYATYNLSIAQPNLPPQGSGPGTLVGTEDAPFTLDVAALFSDPESDPLTFSFTTVPAGASASIAGGNATITPPPDFNGLLQLVLRAVDWFNGAGYLDIALNFSAVNDAPRVNASALPWSVVWDQDSSSGNISFSALFWDPEGDALSLSNETDSAFAAAPCPGLCLAFRAANASFYGAGAFNVTATDAFGLSATALVNYTVTHVNHRPLLIDPPPPSIGIVASGVGAVLDPALYCRDPDGDSLLLSIMGVFPPPSPFAVNASAGGPGSLGLNVSDPEKAGTWTLYTACGDPSNATADFEIVVIVAFPNRAPTMITRFPSADNVTVEENSTLTLSASFADPDGDAITLSWWREGVEVAGHTSSSFPLTLDFDAAGVHRFEARARDPAGLEIIVRWRVNVADVDRPPVCGIDAPDGLTGPVGGKLNFTANATDPDGTPLNYQWRFNGSLGPAGKGASLTLTAGTLRVDLEVEANGVASSCGVVVSGIAAAPPPPPPPPPSALPVVTVAVGVGVAAAAVAFVWLLRRRRPPVLPR